MSFVGIGNISRNSQRFLRKIIPNFYVYLCNIF